MRQITEKEANRAMWTLRQYADQLRRKAVFAEALVEEVEGMPKLLPRGFTIEDLELSVRAHNCLKNYIDWWHRKDGVPENVVLSTITRKKARAIRNMGPSSINEIAAELAKHGIAVKDK